MNVENLVLLDNLSKHYQIEITFFSNLNEMGLLHIIIIDNYKYIHVDQIQDLEKMIRMHNELEINIEGIDVINQLLQRVDNLNEEIISLKNRLNFYENE